MTIKEISIKIYRMNNKRLSVFAVALTMILLLLSVSCVNSAKSNNVKDPPELIEELSESPSYTIIFRQDGYEDVIVVYKKEEDFVAPKPKSVTGYDVAWKDYDLSKIDCDTVVYAEITPKTYTVTFIVNGRKETKSVKYGETVKLPSPTEGQVRRWQSDTIDFIGTEFDYLYDYDLILTAIFE